MNLLPHTPPEVIGQLDEEFFQNLRAAASVGRMATWSAESSTWVRGEDSLAESLQPLLDLILKRELDIKHSVGFDVDVGDLPPHGQQRKEGIHRDGGLIKTFSYTAADIAPTEFFARRILLPKSIDPTEYTSRDSTLRLGLLDRIQHQSGAVVRFKRQLHFSPWNSSSKPIQRTWVRASLG